MTPRPKVPGGRLFLPPAVLEASLSPRQQAALEILRQSEDGLTAHDLGVLVHEHFGTHLDGRPSCEYCSRAGGELARSLKRCGHASQHRGGTFRAVHGGRGSAAPPDPADDDFEWPAGFGDAA